jgi:hypothetical protein
MATVKAKKKCCKDKPRCKKCPVTLKRLSDAGCYQRLDLRTYEILSKPKKATLAAARAR